MPSTLFILNGSFIGFLNNQQGIKNLPDTMKKQREGRILFHIFFVTAAEVYIQYIQLISVTAEQRRMAINSSIFTVYLY